MPNDNLQTTALTRDRVSFCRFDTPDHVLLETSFCLRRERGQIKPTQTQNVMQLSSGVWCLQPINLDRSSLHAKTAAHAGIVRLSELSAVSVLTEVNKWRQLTELPGLAYDASVDTANDWFLRKSIPAGTSWNQSIGASDASLALPSPSLPLDPILESIAADDAMVGYQLTLAVPGVTHMQADWLGIFYFGGSLFADGYGRFGLAISGDGRLQLAEYFNGAWNVHATWRYATPNQTTANAVQIVIIPHYPRHIEISTQVGAANWYSGIGKAKDTAVPQRPAEAPAIYLHNVTNRGGREWNGGDLVPITGSGKIRLEMRRDLRIDVQISRLLYPASGTLTDGAFSLPAFYGSAHIVRLDPVGFGFALGGVPVVSTSFGALNAATGAALTPASETVNWFGTNITYGGWNPPGDAANAIQAQITLTNSEAGPRHHSPALIGYEAKREPHSGTISNGSIAIPIREATITGPDVSPDHESATVRISDAANQLTLLRTRGQSPCLIETQYSPDGDALKTAVLFEGYTGRVTARLRGKRAMVYPDPQWHDYDCQLMGKWRRLSGRFFGQRADFTSDFLSPLGTPAGQPQRPWLVSEVIKWLLYSQGFATDQINIPDSPIRLFLDSITSRAVDQANVAPWTEIGEYLTSVTAGYLNSLLVWDGGAGTRGQWVLVPAPDGTETPVWNFVTTPANPYRPQHQAASYAPLTSPVLGSAPLETWTVPPEGNLLTVSGGGEDLPGNQGRRQMRLTLFNPKSWNLAGASYADPNNLDYLGYVQPIEYVDVTIPTRQALVFTARRIYNIACRGRKFAKFTAELVLIDTNDPVNYPDHAKRAIRTGDTVTIDSGGGPDRWLVHSVSPHWRKDLTQKAVYECELFRPDFTFAYSY